MATIRWIMAAIQWIMVAINPVDQPRNVPCYFILFLIIYVKRVYGFPIISNAMFPLAAHPSVWFPSNLTALNLTKSSWNRTTDPYSPHNSTLTTATDSNILPYTCVIILLATGAVILMIAGVTALSYTLLRSNPAPGQAEHEDQEEGEEKDGEVEDSDQEGGGEEDDEERERSMSRMWSKAVNRGLYLDQPRIINWIKQRAPFQLKKQISQNLRGF